MKLYVTTEQHFYTSNDDNLVYVNGVENALFFQRYLDMFDEVIVIGRVNNNRRINESYQVVNGNSIELFEIPDFVGVGGLLKNILSILKKFKNLFIKFKNDNNAIMLRTPGIIADLTWLTAILSKSPFGVEVVSDPFDMYQKNAVGTNFNFFVQRIALFNTRLQCKYASTSAYVTEYALQKRYPPGNNNTYSYTSLNLNNSVFDYFEVLKKKLKNQQEILCPVNLVFVGTLNSKYKGQDILFEAVRRLKNNKSLSVKLKMVGDGRLRKEFEQMVEDKEIQNNVEFVGQVKPGDEVYRQLASSDIFVLPSRQEGLPRVLIEAMAIGLPSIASDVGGVHELLDEDEMIAVDDTEQLVQKILIYSTDKEKRIKTMFKNHEKAKKYEPRNVQKIRNKHYLNLKNITNSYTV